MNLKKYHILITVGLCALAVAPRLSAQSKEQEVDVSNLHNSPNEAMPQLHTESTAAPTLMVREWSLYGVGGAAAFAYKTDVGTVLPYQNLLSGGGGVEWTFFVKQQIGIRIGLGVMSYKNQWTSNNMTERFTHAVPVTEFGSAAAVETNAEVVNTFDVYEEKQTAWFVQLPLMVQFHPAPSDRRAVFYFAAGVKPALNLANSYSLETSGNTAVNVADYQQILDNAGHGTGPFTYSRKGKMDMNFNLNLSAEIGLRWRVKPTFAIYTGLYADYGQLSIKAQKNPILPFGAGGEVNPLFASQHLSGSVNTVSAGIKLRLAFGTARTLPTVDIAALSAAPKAYVRIIVRDGANVPLPTALKESTDHNAADDGTHTPLEYTVANDNYRIALQENSDYSMTLKTKLPDNADRKNMLVFTPQEPKKEPKDNGVSRLNIALQDEETGMFVPYIVRKYDMEGNMVDTFNTAATNGRYSIPSIQKGSFHRLIFNVAPQSKVAKQTVFKNIRPGAQITISDIVLTRAGRFTPKIKDELQKVIDFMLEHNEVTIFIGVHTDNRLPKTIRKKQTAARAKAIVNYMVKNGVDRHRLRSAGYGSAQPVGSNKKKAGRAQNRRIEVTIAKIDAN